MSAAPSNLAILQAAQPPPRGATFIDLEEAARRSGRSQGHLARLCRKTWAAQNLAKLAAPKGGGKPVWTIREDASPELGRVKFPDQIPFDMTAIPRAHRDLILSREKILDEWRTAISARPQGQTEDGATRTFCEIARDIDGHKLSRSTLYRWADAHRAQGRAGLQDDRKTRAKTRGGDETDPFLLEVKRLWGRLSQPKLLTCYKHARLIAEDQGWAVPTFKKVQRFVARIPPQWVIKYRLGDTAYENQVVPPVRRDYTTLRSNQLWCADHHQLDVICKGPDGKLARPWLTAWEDLRSRKIVGYRLFCHDPNQTTILLAFKDACLSHGVPEGAYVDNGKDFDSWALQGRTKQERRRIKVTLDGREVGGVFGALGVAVQHAKPYNAKAKPVERFFMTLKTGFSQMFFATYCGGTTAEKPEDLPEQIARGNAPAFEDVAAALATWIDAAYNAAAHAGDGLDGRAPEICWADHLESKRTCRLEDLELLCQKTSRELCVTNQGVVWEGLRYGKGDPALDPHFGKKVYLRIDPADLTQASAWTSDDRLIGFLKANHKMPFGATEQEFREAEHTRKRVRNLVKQARDLGPRRTYDTLDLMAEKRAKDLAAQKRAKGDPTKTPPSIVPVRTAIEGQLAALQSARQPLALRLAAGAEALSPSPGTPGEGRGEGRLRSSLLDQAPDLDAPRASSTGSILSYAERLGD